MATVPVPANDASLEDILRFATATYSGYDLHGGVHGLAELANPILARWQAEAVLPDDLNHVRAALFFEARRWHHYGYAPDEDAEKYIRALVKRLRASSRGS